VAQLQARLLSLAASRPGTSACARLEVAAATAATVAAAPGHIVLLGLPGASPLTGIALDHHIALSAQQLKSDGSGLITVSRRSIAHANTKDGAIHPLLLTITGCLTRPCIEAARAALAPHHLGAVQFAVTKVLSGTVDIATVHIADAPSARTATSNARVA
jgi:hypothetical protein